MIGCKDRTVKNVGKNCTIKGLNGLFETYVLIDMKIVGTISDEKEAKEIQTIVRLSVVAQRARLLGRNIHQNN